MILAVVLIVASVLALVLILRVTVSRNLLISEDESLTGQIQPIDIEAFRNLVNPDEDEYLRRRLPAGECRAVRRKRLRATAAYVRVVARNSAILIRIGQAAMTSRDPRAAEAARELVNDALLLRRNASFALLKIYVLLAWPNAGPSAAPLLHDYEQMSGVAMLLGRLQNPSSPVRPSATW